jgi:CRP-like cAMP-binding protein
MEPHVDRTTALKKMPLLAVLPHSDIETIAQRMEVKGFEPGDEIIKQGAAGDAAYFVLSGQCEVRRKVGRASKRVAFIEPGNFFGELSIVAPAPRSASVVATEPSVLLVLTATEFNNALRTNRSMALQLVRVLAVRLQKAVDEFGASGA